LPEHVRTQREFLDNELKPKLDAATAKLRFDGDACWIEVSVSAVDVGLLA
jgi:hypothetical protein